MNEECNSCSTICSGLECHNIASDCQRMPYITRPTGRRQAAQLRVRAPEPGPAPEYIHASQKKRKRKGNKQVDRTERDAAPRPANPYMNVQSRWHRLMKEQRRAKRRTRDSTAPEPPLEQRMAVETPWSPHTVLGQTGHNQFQEAKPPVPAAHAEGALAVPIPQYCSA